MWPMVSQQDGDATRQKIWSRRENGGQVMGIIQDGWWFMYGWVVLMYWRLLQDRGWGC